MLPCFFAIYYYQKNSPPKAGCSKSIVMELFLEGFHREHRFFQTGDLLFSLYTF